MTTRRTFAVTASLLRLSVFCVGAAVTFGSSALAAEGAILGTPTSGAPDLPDANCGASYDEARRAADFKVQGEFAGALRGVDQAKHDYGAQLVALGCAKFHLVVYPGGLPGGGWRKSAGLYRVNGAMSEGALRFAHANGWNAVLVDEDLQIQDQTGARLGLLKRIVRTSPTLGLKPPAGATVLFDGTSVDQFHGGKTDAERRLVPGAVSRQEFGDCTVHVEFLTPFAPELRGQGRCNSGIHMQGRYELQILDSFGLEGLKNECGGVYRIAGPDVNMCLPPMTWQTYDIEFTAPRFDADGFKMHNATMTVRHNGVVVHDRLNVYRTTASDSPPEAPGPHPLSLQGRDPVVLFRNLWIVERPPTIGAIQGR